MGVDHVERDQQQSKDLDVIVKIWKPPWKQYYSDLSWNCDTDYCSRGWGQATE